MAKVEITFPLKGKNTNFAASTQPPLTSPDLNNVRPNDVSEKRARGGQRPGLDLRYGERISTNGTKPCILIFQITTVAT